MASSARGATTLGRIMDMVKLRASILGHAFNPQNVRTGAKVLRRRLRGPALLGYYPRRYTTAQELERLFPGMETVDERESDRWDGIALARSRGKGKPKKKRTAEESKRLQKRKAFVSKPAET